MRVDWHAVDGVVWDWGNTLMRVCPEQKGPMVSWPRVEAMPGAATALRAFVGLPQCVATNATASDVAAVAAALARVGLDGYLTGFFTSAELGVRKPDPAFFEAVADRLSMPAGKLLAIGDDPDRDTAPAQRAGLQTVLVGAGAGRDQSGADLAVSDLGALAAVVLRDRARGEGGRSGLPDADGGTTRPPPAPS